MEVALRIAFLFWSGFIEVDVDGISHISALRPNKLGREPFFFLPDASTTKAPTVDVLVSFFHNCREKSEPVFARFRKSALHGPLVEVPLSCCGEIVGLVDDDAFPLFFCSSCCPATEPWESGCTAWNGGSIFALLEPVHEDVPT